MAVPVAGAGQLITKLYTGLVPVQLLLSVTVTVIGKVPAWVGVPLNTPAADKLNPVGKVLTVVNVTGNAPPDCVKVWLNGVPAVPVVTPGLVTVIVGQVAFVAGVSVGSVLLVLSSGSSVTRVLPPL